MNELYGIVGALHGDANLSRQNLGLETWIYTPMVPKIQQVSCFGEASGDRETRSGDEMRAGMTAGCSEIY